jgi:hypothetical protein
VSGATSSAVDRAGLSDRAERVATLRALVDRTRPVSLAGQRVLPVLPALEACFSAAGGPQGLQRGSVVQVVGVAGATTLALALAAGPTRAGSWAAFVGLPELAWAAAAEVGVDLDRVVVVRPTERTRVTVLAALVDAFDVVLCGLGAANGRAGTLSATEARRLSARARERGSVLLVVGGRTGGVGPARRVWAGAADAELVVVDQEWSGLGQGWGHLRSRRVTVETGGRRGLDRPRRLGLWLPDGNGSVTAAETDLTSERTATERTATERTATVTPLRRVG